MHKPPPTPEQVRRNPTAYIEELTHDKLYPWQRKALHALCKRRDDRPAPERAAGKMRVVR